MRRPAAGLVLLFLFLLLLGGLGGLVRGRPGRLALMPQLVPSPGLPERQAVQRRMDRVMAMLPTLPTAAQEAILSEVGAPGQQSAPAAPPDATQPIDPEQERRDKPGRWPPHWPGGGG